MDKKICLILIEILVINYKKEDSHILDKLEEMETAFTGQF